MMGRNTQGTSASHASAKQRRWGLIIALTGSGLLESLYGCAGADEVEAFVEDHIGEVSEALIESEGESGGGSPTPYCGDGICNNSETASSCRSDCGYCGDGVCFGGESAGSCADCRLKFSGAYMTDWGGCDSSCSGSGGLSHTDDQIDGFDSRMAAHGHTRMHKFANSSVWSSDYVEDQISGQDHLFSDDSDLVAFSGHGSAPTYSDGQTFQAPMCRQSTTSSCWYDAEDSRFGERAGAYAYPNAGTTRWLMWLTCYSVHTAPHEQWGEALWQGLEYVMGYRDTSLDSSTTEEVPGDWVDEAIGGTRGFKSAWFWAIEDWWANDTGAVVSTGPDESSAANRRDNLNRNWARRNAYEYGYYVAWSWHEG